MAAEPLTEFVVRLDSEQVNVLTQVAKQAEMTVEEFVQTIVELDIDALIASIANPEMAQELSETALSRHMLRRYEQR